jgi:hypothetical protein
VTSDNDAEGWYLNPYGLHERRWFSAGDPSRLVRDGLVEANDPPPVRPFDGPLKPALTDAAHAGGSDFRRADEAEGNGPSAYSDAAINAWGPIVPRPDSQPAPDGLCDSLDPGVDGAS